MIVWVFGSIRDHQRFDLPCQTKPPTFPNAISLILVKEVKLKRVYYKNASSGDVRKYCTLVLNTEDHFNLSNIERLFYGYIRIA